MKNIQHLGQPLTKEELRQFRGGANPCNPAITCCQAPDSQGCVPQTCTDSCGTHSCTCQHPQE